MKCVKKILEIKSGNKFYLLICYEYFLTLSEELNKGNCHYNEASMGPSCRPALTSVLVTSIPTERAPSAGAHGSGETLVDLTLMLLRASSPQRLLSAAFLCMPCGAAGRA